MGIVIGEAQTDKRGKTGGREIVGKRVTRTHTRTLVQTLIRYITYILYVHTRTHADTHRTSGIRDSLPLCVMASKLIWPNGFLN